MYNKKIIGGIKMDITIDVNDYKLNVIGKGNKERTIYLNKACVNAIRAYLDVRPKVAIKVDDKNSQKALFLSKRHERISNRTVQYIVDKELRKLVLIRLNILHIN